MIVARQSTARTVMVGPVLDADGVAVTTAVVGDFKLSKNGGAPAALNASATLTHRNTGHYSLALTASDLDTVGQAEVVIDKTTDACPPKEVTVLEEAVYDALFAASAVGPLLANSDGSGLTEAGGTGDHLTAINLPDQTMNITGDITGNLSGSVGSVTGAVGSVTGNVGGNVAGSVGSVTGAVGSVTGNVGGNVAGSVGSVATGGIAAASFAAGAIDAAAIAADAIGASELAASAITEIQSGLSTLDAAGVRTAVGLASANLDTQLTAIDDAIDTEVGAIKTRVELALPNAAPDSNGGLPIQQTVGAEDVLSAKVHLTDQAETDLIQSIPAEILAADNSVAGPDNSVSAQLIDAALAATPAEVTSAVSGLATQASVNTIDDFLDTEIAAIKAKTDQLTFTVANKVDATATADVDVDESAIAQEVVGALAGTSVTINAPVVNGTITLHVNADYTIALGRQVRITLAAGAYADISTATAIRLGVTKLSDNTGGFTVGYAARSGHASNAQTIDFEPSSEEETNSLDSAYDYGYTVVVSYDANTHVVVAEGKVIVKANRVS
jgi:uncharacterized protein YjbJ (UPF0337 family)